MGWLEFEGYKALRKEALKIARGLTNEIKTHITKEVERVMTEINRLDEAVTKELADDAAQNELIAELKSQLEAATQAAADAQAGQAGAEERLAEALSAATSAAERLESNDPVEEPPVDPDPEV